MALDQPRAALQGLSEEEVLSRWANGQGNDAKLRTSRSYGQIIRENVFTFVNNVLFVLGIALVALGRLSDALVSVGVILANVVVSVVQEVRAKRTLDRIALLTRPTATVIRDGLERAVDPAEIVVGDLLRIRPGDQVVVDGQVVGDGCTDVDESLLSGESDLIPKRAGDPVYSGSFCVNGGALYEAQKVGSQSIASQLATGARAFRRVLTPLQRETNLVIRVILLIAFYFNLVLVIVSLIEALPFVEGVRRSVVVIGLVPNGLFLAMAVAYAMGAVRIAGRGALVQQANAIESLSNVDVLCLDKTGTLTANRIHLHAVQPLGLAEGESRQLLGDFVASTSSGNRTSEAIAQGCPGQRWRAVVEVPFSSERKWSGLALDDEGRQGTYVLGAPEILRPHMELSAASWPTGRSLQGVGSDPAGGPAVLGAQEEVAQMDWSALSHSIDTWAEQGLRVLLFAGHPSQVPLHDEAGQPALPTGLVPLGLVSLSDELRPETRETLASFAQAGVQLKIISGDNPQTVAALARQAGLEGDLQAVSGQELAQMDEPQFAQAVAKATILGRITPQQKERIVRTLHDQDHYVAMIGDGVNDVLSLKQADLGVAMQSGSQATRSVADIILLGDSFAALPRAVQEGQRIVNGMQDILRLFLTRVFYVALLILSIGIIGGFPFEPKHNSVLTTLTVGIPTLALAAWARPGPTPRGQLMRRLLHFVLPAALTMSFVALGAYLLYLLPAYRAHLAANPGLDPRVAFNSALAVGQTALINFVILGGLLLLPFVEPPTPFWVGGDTLSGDRRPTILALVLLAIYGAILATPTLRQFFELAPLALIDYALIGGITLLWALLLRWIWRARLLDRFLDVDLGFSVPLPSSRQGTRAPRKPR